MSAILALVMGLSCQSEPERRLAALIERLGSEKAEERQDAAQTLAGMGASALPALQAAALGKDPEIAGRAADVVRTIRESVPATAAIAGDGPFTILPSRTGRFVAVLSGKSVHLFEAGTLKPLKTIEMAATTVGFDAKDAEVTVIGESLVRLETRGWKETFRAPLPEAGFGRHGQAWVGPAGEIYYRANQGELALATLANGTLKTEKLEARNRDLPGVGRILGMIGDDVILTAGNADVGAVWIASSRRSYTLAGTTQVLAAYLTAGNATFVCRETVASFTPLTWKGAGHIAQSDNQHAALDLRGRRFLVSDPRGLRVLPVDKPGQESIYEPVTARPSALAVDSEARLLYMVPAGAAPQLHCWQLRN